MNNIQKLENKTTKRYMKIIDCQNYEFKKQRIAMRKHCKLVQEHCLYPYYFMALKSERDIWTR